MVEPAVGTLAAKHEAGDLFVVVCYGTLPKMCSEPVSLRSWDSPYEYSRSISVLLLTVLQMCYWVEGDAFLVTAKVA